jgi:hypothetical protein
MACSTAWRAVTAWTTSGRSTGTKTRQVVCGLSLGYADTTHPANQFRTTRAPVEAVVDWWEH